MKHTQQTIELLRKKNLGALNPMHGKEAFNRVHYILPNMNPKVTYILGVLITDGSIRKELTHLEFGMNDKEVIIKLQSYFYDLFNYKCKISKRILNTKKEHFMITISSKDITIYFKSLLNNLDFLLIENEENICNFLQGCYDGDGCFDTWDIYFNNTNLKLIKLIEKLLTILNINFKSSVMFYKGTTVGFGKFNNDYWVIDINGKQNIILFMQKINTTISRKRRRVKFASFQ